MCVLTGKYVCISLRLFSPVPAGTHTHTHTFEVFAEYELPRDLFNGKKNYQAARTTMNPDEY